MQPHRRPHNTPARRWQPLADAEWEALLPFVLVRNRPGRFRRLCHAGLWERLLKALARPDAPPALLTLEHWVASACRRAARLGGLGLLVLAKRLGFLSALRAPPLFLFKPDLSELVERWLRRGAEHARGRPPGAELLEYLRFCHRLGAFAAGRSRLGRRFLPV